MMAKFNLKERVSLIIDALLNRVEEIEIGMELKISVPRTVSKKNEDKLRLLRESIESMLKKFS